MPEPRLRTCTVKQGRVHFNEVIIESQPPADLVVLAAIDPDAGLYVWTCATEDVAAQSGPQHPGYSSSPGSFAIDAPPRFVRTADYFPREIFDARAWDDATCASTNTKNRRVRALLENIGFL